MKLLHDVPAVYILGYQRHHAHPLNRWEVSPNKLGELYELLLHDGIVILHGEWVVVKQVMQSHFCAVSPYDLVNDGHSLW